ncbi:hypothetical protein M2139_002650 [Enterococcus sp. PF1-24]|uniref:hypothetical protein n=1 Tax=unclassified Enterococcus TaxID=2608891 RepID=UPI002472FCCE|nr:MULTISPECIES: hypothetical protein [unclassified Enterococcus]MDH6365643.1 hypothetical protein [Enterococcus sp. PFB1-1]MDH6402744.1 hypothetical protein [Enterococcus sp. PF1-24]
MKTVQPNFDYACYKASFQRLLKEKHNKVPCVTAFCTLISIEGMQQSVWIALEKVIEMKKAGLNSQIIMRNGEVIITTTSLRTLKKLEERGYVYSTLLNRDVNTTMQPFEDAEHLVRFSKGDYNKHLLETVVPEKLQKIQEHYLNVYEEERYRQRQFKEDGEFA